MSSTESETWIQNLSKPIFCSYDYFPNIEVFYINIRFCIKDI